MKLVMTLLVRNEDDILEDNLKVHLKLGVDYFIAMDHLSTDGTTDILNKYENLGVLKRIPQTSEMYNQGVWVTQMAQQASTEYKADWVINNDADEFWIPSKGSLKDFLGGIPTTTGKLHVNRLDYHFLPFKASKYYDVMVFREWMCRWTKCCHRGAADVDVEMGNHNARSVDLAARCSGELHTSEKIMIHHYPVRSYDRYREKMNSGGQLVWKTPGLSLETSHHWKNALKKIEEGSFEEFFKEKIYDDDKLTKGVKDNSILIDTTVQKIINNMESK